MEKRASGVVRVGGGHGRLWSVGGLKGIRRFEIWAAENSQKADKKWEE